ncbi:MAG: hypothetical protein V1793_08560 [Pseudomonadota bacterium]
MKSMAEVLIWALVATGLAAGSCFAGAWTEDKGAVYHKLTVNSYEADEAFNDSENTVPLADHGKFSDTNISYYLEYGISDRLTALGSVSLKQLESDTDIRVARTDGFSDLDLGLKYRLLSGDMGVVSVQGLVKVPELYDEDEAVAMGNGQYDVEFRILYGRSLYPVVPGYFNIEAGYRFRADEPADELRYLVEFGMDITQAIYSRLKLDGILGMNNQDSATDVSDNPTTTLNCDLGKLELALGFKLSNRWNLELGYRNEIYGKNTAAGENLSLSLILAY